MRRIVLLAVIVVLLSACKVKVEQGFELNADGSGEAVMIVAFDQEAQEMLSSSVPPGVDPLEGMTSGVQPGWASEEWSQGGFKGFRATARFADPASLQRLVETDFSGEDGMFQSFSIVATAGGYRLDGVLSGESLEQSMDGSEDVFAGAAEDMVESFFEASIVIKLPGQVVSHNADEVRSDGTLIWNVGVSDGGRAIRAESGPGTSLPIVPMAAGALVVGAAIAGFLAWQRRRPPVNPIGRLEYDQNGKPQLVAVEGDPYA
jgi:hypothetical protein